MKRRINLSRHNLRTKRQRIVFRQEAFNMNHGTVVYVPYKVAWTRPL